MTNLFSNFNDVKTLLFKMNLACDDDFCEVQINQPLPNCKKNNNFKKHSNKLDCFYLQAKHALPTQWNDMAFLKVGNASYRLNNKRQFASILFFLKKMGHSWPIFLYFHLFSTQLTVNKCSIYVKLISKPRLPLSNDCTQVTK